MLIATDLESVLECWYDYWEYLDHFPVRPRADLSFKGKTGVD